MAVGTEKVGSLSWAGKIPRSFPVNPCLPVLIDVPMAFATEFVAFCEVDELPVEKPEFVAIPCIVAIKAPSHRLRMMEPDIGMFILQLPLLSVHLQRGMAIAAGENALCHRRRRDGKFLTCTTHKGDEIDP
jgi:hypothetical protein